MVHHELSCGRPAAHMRSNMRRTTRRAHHEGAAPHARARRHNTQNPAQTSESPGGVLANGERAQRSTARPSAANTMYIALAG